MHACGLARTTVALAYIITGQANGGLLMHSTWQRMRRPHATPSLTSACFFMRWASVPAATRLMVHAHHVNNNHAAGHDAAVAGASMFQMAASPFLQAVLPLATPPPPLPPPGTISAIFSPTPGRCWPPTRPALAPMPAQHSPPHAC